MANVRQTSRGFGSHFLQVQSEYIVNPDSWWCTTGVIVLLCGYPIGLYGVLSYMFISAQTARLRDAEERYHLFLEKINQMVRRLYPNAEDHQESVDALAKCLEKLTENAYNDFGIIAAEEVIKSTDNYIQDCVNHRNDPNYIAGRSERFQKEIQNITISPAALITVLTAGIVAFIVGTVAVSFAPIALGVTVATALPIGIGMGTGAFLTSLGIFGYKSHQYRNEIAETANSYIAQQNFLMAP